MTTAFRFVQIHTLTFYGPNNLNRDDLSRPKTAMLGTAPRLRLSSQCVKRAWRLSDVMNDVATGLRSRSLWAELAREFSKDHAEALVLEHIHPLRQALEGIKVSVADGAEPEADAKAKKGKAKKGVLGIDDLIGATFFYHDSEVQAVRLALTKSLTAGVPLTAQEAEDAVTRLTPSADVAMFGRMAASKRSMSIDGAVQVAHQVTTHKAVAEDDFFVACDDLNTGESEDVAGSAHMGVAAFGSGLYYGYVNVDVAKLVANLNGDVALAKRALQALIRAVTTVAPSAKQNTYACHSLASYARVEVGNAQPRSLVEAFSKPVTGSDLLEASILALQAKATGIARAYPSQALAFAELNCAAEVGTEDELLALALQALAE